MKVSFTIYVVTYTPTGDVSCETEYLDNAVQFFYDANNEEMNEGREPAYALTARLETKEF